MKHDQHCTLYRLYDEAGDLIYVGIAGNPGRRFEQHAKDKPWWDEVDRIELSHFDSRQAALDAEREAIKSESPRHNVVHAERLRVPKAEAWVEWFCDICTLSVRDGDGYVEIRHEEVAEAEEAERRWRASKPSGEMYAIDVIDASWLMSMPEPARWLIHHRDCDPFPESSSYFIDVERVRSPWQLLEWTIHLNEKVWVSSTDWDSFIRRVIARSSREALTA